MCRLLHDQSFLLLTFLSTSFDFALTRFYYQKQNLSHHIKSSHEGKMYECTFPECGRKLCTLVSENVVTENRCCRLLYHHLKFTSFCFQCIFCVYVPVGNSNHYFFKSLPHLLVDLCIVKTYWFSISFTRWQRLCVDYKVLKGCAINYYEIPKHIHEIVLLIQYCLPIGSWKGSCGGAGDLENSTSIFV